MHLMRDVERVGGVRRVWNMDEKRTKNKNGGGLKEDFYGLIFSSEKNSWFANKNKLQLHSHF